MITKQQIAAAVLVAVPSVMAFEGLVLRPYRDPIGKLTVCYGETHEAMQDYTPAECKSMLIESLQKHGEQIAPCLPESLPANVLASVISFAYNVGSQAFCNSTMARKLKAADIAGACAELPRWVYAGGKVLPGLVKRRAAERAICEGRPLSLGGIG